MSLIDERSVIYKDSEDEAHYGWMASPSQGESKGGVIVIHEWWGLNDYAKRRARMLAQAGYTALAADMYTEGRTARDPEEAGRLAAEVMKEPNVLRTRFAAACLALKEHGSVPEDRVAAVGYCFGGAVVLNTARAGFPLKLVASFHGLLQPVIKAESGRPLPKILVFHAEDDAFVDQQQLKAFEEEMTGLGADYEIITYPKVKHSFTNPEADKNAKRFGLPLGYDRKADEDSWQKLLDALEQTLTQA